jgi:hypothetical protein
LIIQFKPRNVRYSVDEILETACHTPLWLLPYHPDLNPIERIWAKVGVRPEMCCIIQNRWRKLKKKSKAMGREDWLPLWKICKRTWTWIQGMRNNFWWQDWQHYHKFMGNGQWQWFLWQWWKQCFWWWWRIICDC